MRTATASSTGDIRMLTRKVTVPAMSMFAHLLEFEAGLTANTEDEMRQLDEHRERKSGEERSGWLREHVGVPFQAQPKHVCTPGVRLTMSTHGRLRRSLLVKGDTVDGGFNGVGGDTSVKGECRCSETGYRRLTYILLESRMATIALHPLI